MDGHVVKCLNIDCKHECSVMSCEITNSTRGSIWYVTIKVWEKSIMPKYEVVSLS